jgi:hypothetical protein
MKASEIQFVHPNDRFAPTVLQKSKIEQPNISPKLTFALLCRCIAFQRRYGGA